MKYSFLVCAYNAEQYLKECLDSLVNQTIDKRKYEIIVVNDGSTDKTKKIASSYKGVKVVTQRNKGLAEARNTAFDASKGEWLLYVDADDYVSLDLLETIEKRSLKKYNFVQYNEVKEEEAAKKDKKVQANKMDDSIVSRAIRRDIMENYRFPGKYRFAIEDWDFYVHNIEILKPLDLTKKKCFYFYRYNENSLSKAAKVYRSRLEHAISIFENKRLRRMNLDNRVIGHHYEHLYMMARLWFPDLLPRVKAIKFKTRVSFATKLQFYVVKLGFMNWLIKRLVKKIDR